MDEWSLTGIDVGEGINITRWFGESSLQEEMKDPGQTPLHEIGIKSTSRIHWRCLRRCPRRLLQAVEVMQVSFAILRERAKDRPTC